MIIDELFMVLGDLRTDIDARFGEIFMMIPEEVFSGLSVINVMGLLSLPLWNMCLAYNYGTYFKKHAEMTEVVSQNDKLFIDLLNNAW